MSEHLRMMTVDCLKFKLTPGSLAVLIGLRNMKVQVESLVCLTDINEGNKVQVLAVERWLKKNHFPPLRFSTEETDQEPSSLCDHLLKTWHWDEKECEFVVRLEGLPLS